MREHIDAICGHAPASVGRSYSTPTLADKAAELRNFPRYEFDSIRESNIRESKWCNFWLNVRFGLKAAKCCAAAK